MADPIAIISGYPGSAGVTSFRSAFKYTLQSLAYPDVYPATPAGSIEPHGAYTKVLEAHKWFEIPAYLQLTNSLTVFSKTDPNYYSGWALAFASAVKANKTSFVRRLQPVIHPIDAVTEPIVTEIVTSWQWPVQHVRHDERRLQSLPRLHTYPRIEPSNEAYAPVDTLRRRETARILQFPAEINVYPPKATPVAAVYAAIVDIRQILGLRRQATLFGDHLRRERFKTNYPGSQQDASIAPQAAELCQFEVAAENNDFSIAAENDEFVVPRETNLFAVGIESCEFKIDVCGESGSVVPATASPIILPGGDYPSYLPPRSYYSRNSRRFAPPGILPWENKAGVDMTDKVYSDTQTFMQAKVSWIFDDNGRFRWLAGDGAIASFNVVADQWFVGHPINVSEGNDYEVALISSAENGSVIARYFQDGSVRAIGEWATMSADSLHVVRRPTSLGTGTSSVVSRYQIRLIGEAPILADFTITATVTVNPL